MLGHSQMNTFMVLLPALLLHGTFDFALFLLGFLEFAYNIQSVAFAVVSFVTPIAITLAGIFWARREFHKVECSKLSHVRDDFNWWFQVVDAFENGWQRAGIDEEQAMNAQL